jgi:hypothetical protein
VYFNYAGIMATAYVKDISASATGSGHLVKLEKVDWGAKVGYWSEMANVPDGALFLLWYRVPSLPPCPHS